MKAADARNFLLGVVDERGIDRLFRFEYGVDAFGRDDDLALVVKNKGRILPIEYHDVDLVAESAVAVNHVSFLGVISLRQIFLQELKPDTFARVALRNGMGKDLARNRQTAL